MPRGGKRPGSGIKKGYKYKHTLEKQAARELVRRLVTANLEPMLRAQIANACGLGYVYTRDKTGKFSRVESQERIDQLLAEGVANESYFLFSKDPSPASFKELLDRALDRPKEQAQEIHISGEILTARLTQARRRIAIAQGVDLSRATETVGCGTTTKSLEGSVLQHYSSGSRPRGSL
jgi:hypothetical protein